MNESNKFDNNNTAKYNSQTNTELCIIRKETKTISLYFYIYKIDIIQPCIWAITVLLVSHIENTIKYEYLYHTLEINFVLVSFLNGFENFPYINFI